MEHQLTTDKIHEMAIAAMQEAVKEVVEKHRASGRPLAVWRDGRVQYVN